MIVFFDIDGTLVDYKFAERAGAIQYYNEHMGLFNFLEAEFIKLWGDLAYKYFNRYLNKELTFDEQRRSRMKALFKTVGIELSDLEAESEFSTYESFYRDNWKAFDDVIPCLNQLKDVQLGVISNGDYKHQIDKLKRVGLVDYFLTVVTSGEVGYSKPDKRIFIEACKKLGKTPEQCNYVGDDLTIDISGSNAAGLKGIWLNRKQENAEQKNIVSIEDLYKLPNLLYTLHLKHSL